MGGLTYKRSVVGQQLTERSLPRDARSPKQVASRGRFSKGSDAWSALEKPDQDLWNFASKEQKRRDDVTGVLYSLTGRTYFIGLSAKFAQIQPGVALPTQPPVVRFAGDDLTLSLDINNSTVSFKSSAANAPSASTEMLAQRLASPDRAPVEGEYVSLGFHKFTGSASDAFTTYLGPGVWSLAFRFVCPATGEEKELVEMSTLVLGLTAVEGGLAETEAKPKAKKAA